jgi:photosystem II stability/assembly factor-like uncharacterized protein
VETVAAEQAEPEQATPKPLPNVPLTAASEDWQQQTHIHGIGVNPSNPEVVYIATHHGIVIRSPEGEWLQLGDDRSDLMGFAMHPEDQMLLYRSGHPGHGHDTGGSHNLGFEVSADGGASWQRRSMEGVDFHTLAIAPGHPDVIYGLATSGQQGLFKSDDGGNTWTPLAANGLEATPFKFAIAPQNSDHVFATTQAGLFESNDGGQTWTLLPNTATAPLTDLITIEAGDSDHLVGFQLTPSGQTFVISQNQGQSWEPLGNSQTEGVVLHMAAAPSDPTMLYAATDQNQIYQSSDGGETWTVLN